MTNPAEEQLENTPSGESTLEDGQNRRVEVRTGIAGMVQANEVSITESGVLVAVAAQDLQIQSGGGSLIVAGRDMSITSGGGSVLIAGNSINVQNGGSAAMITSSATVNQGFVALLICGKAELGDGSRVLLTAPQAAVLGAALGLMLTVAGRLLRRN